MAKKVLLWGMGRLFVHRMNQVKYHELQGQFKVVGITSNLTAYEEFYGYRYIGKSEIANLNIDCIIVMTEKDAYLEIVKEAVGYNIPESRIFNCKVLELFEFDLERYLRLREGTPSIFANNCWGGVTYHRLGLQFRSPLVNMFESEEDYIKLLQNPRKYMNEELFFLETKHNEIIDIDYPVAKCGDIELHFNHDTSFENAKANWEKRKKRIDWDNMFIMMFTERYDMACEFAKLPYDKKICFVPFESFDSSIVQVDLNKKEGLDQLPFWAIVLGMATGDYPYYNVFDLLEDAKISPIAKLSV